MRRARTPRKQEDANVDSDSIGERAAALADALVAGDVELATQDFSPELRRNLGEVIAMLPLPVSEATVESIERGASAFVVELRLVGETDEVIIQTRWKDRDGRPTVVEASHLSQTTREADDDATATEPEASGDEQ
jgi:hypothetical protein